MSSTADSSSSSSSSSTSSSSSSSPASAAVTSAALSYTSADYYFDSSGHFGVHEELLKDKSRMRSWKKVIDSNAHLFAGKTVLDLGSGTGILSMMAVKAGAKKVYAVESAEIFYLAQRIVEVNHMTDTIQMFHGKIEDEKAVQLPEKVDVILCDWMGFFLFQDSLLDPLLFARKKYLKEGGIVLPDRAAVYLTAIEDGEYHNEKIDWWSDVYGFQMSVIQGLAVTEPLIDNCPPAQIITNQPAKVIEFDLNTADEKDLLEFKTNYSLTVTQENNFHALVAWWEVTFSPTHTKVLLSTSPRADHTHWKQTVFYLEKPLHRLKVNQHITGEFVVNRNPKNAKEVDITIGVNVGQASQKKTYHLR